LYFRKHLHSYLENEENPLHDRTPERIENSPAEVAANESSGSDFPEKLEEFPLPSSLLLGDV
jgi:hypothetical protein